MPHWRTNLRQRLADLLIEDLLKVGAQGYVKSEGTQHLVAAVQALAYHKPYCSSKWCYLRRLLPNTAIHSRHRSRTGNAKWCGWRPRDTISAKTAHRAAIMRNLGSARPPPSCATRSATSWWGPDNSPRFRRSSSRQKRR